MEDFNLTEPRPWLTKIGNRKSHFIIKSRYRRVHFTVPQFEIYFMKLKYVESNVKQKISNAPN